MYAFIIYYIFIILFLLGMYSMRMLDNGCNLTQNCVERGTDSDSAVSSMGSERVPSLSSDTEWMETNSDSGHTPADHYTPDYW